MADADLYWVAGLLEGEGSFVWHQTIRDKGRPRIQLQMADEDVVAHVSQIMGGTMTGPYGPYGKSKLQTWFASSSGKGAYDVMKQLLPLMGTRRKEQITKVMEKYENLIGGH